MLGVPSPPAGAQQAPAGPPLQKPPAPTAARRSDFLLASEDTVDIPVTELPTLEITTTRLGIAEIVDRCIREEEARSRRIRSHEATLEVKTTLEITDKKGFVERKIVQEDIFRTKTEPDRKPVSTLISHQEYELVGEERKPREQKPEGDDEGGVKISIDEVNGLPFYLADRNDYRFTIRGREIVGDRVVYEVGLEPRSDFEVAPKGRIWIDTSNFVILREEFDFEDRVPMPIFVKSLGPVIRERSQVGSTWVTSRLLVRCDLKMGWLKFLDDEIPDRVFVVASYRDHRVQEGPTPQVESGQGAGTAEAEPSRRVDDE